MQEVWLHHGKITENNNTALWSGSSEIYENNQAYHFKIQGNCGMVSIRTGRDFKWKLVVIPSSGKPIARFVHEDFPNHGVCIDEFLMDREVGEGAFHLVVDCQSKRLHLKMNQSEKEGPFVSVEPHQPLRRAGLVDGDSNFTFCIGHKW